MGLKTSGLFYVLQRFNQDNKEQWFLNDSSYPVLQNAHESPRIVYVRFVSHWQWNERYPLQKQGLGVSDESL